MHTNIHAYAHIPFAMVNLQFKNLAALKHHWLISFQDFGLHFYTDAMLFMTFGPSGQVFWFVNPVEIPDTSMRKGDIWEPRWGN